MKKYFVVIFLSVFSFLAKAEIYTPVMWSFECNKLSGDEAEIVLTANIDEGWHLYSQHMDEGGPVATSFTFTPSADYKLKGDVEEMSKAIKAFDPNFQMDIVYFSHVAVFKQKVTLLNKNASIKGSVNFMVCNDEQCLPPDDKDFTVSINPNSAKDGGKVSETKDKTSVKSSNEKDVKTVPAQKKESLWKIFIIGFLGGLAAFFMPCIFPMIPFTVSYFTKTKNKKSGVLQALLYGLFIIVIYVTLGLVITLIFGADALNSLATNGIFNFFFFLLLVVFAFSFLGAFEIVLPSSWGNKADAKSDKGGFVGLFFMAATLSIVSFSCTGPIIGTLLVEAATMGHIMGPASGMLGFSLALALPFTIFSMFPSLLKSMPKSGGWLNSVKVVLGFLELALALKFLSNVDLAYHWNLFDREVFLVLWITIFGFMGLYLLGKLKFSHDSELTHISSFRLLLAIITVAFTIYLIPGLWGAPLKSVSAFLPPMQSQDFDLYTPTLMGNTSSNKVVKHEDVKYGDIFEAPYGLNAYFDYEEGIKEAKKENKPVMIDFTGHACVNCRKMEADVWSDSKVLDIIRNDYILIQLYVDDKTELEEDEQYVSDFSGKKISSIGNKWSDFQASRFNSNSQPFYVLLDPDGNLLADPEGAEYDIDKFLTFLNKGIEE